MCGIGDLAHSDGSIVQFIPSRVAKNEEKMQTHTSTVSFLAASVAPLEDASLLQSKQMFSPVPYGSHTFST